MKGRGRHAARRTPHESRKRAASPPPSPLATGAPLTRRACVGVALALLGIWLLLFAPTLDGRNTFVLGDAGRYSVFADFSRARFASSGERTFWNPYVFMGLPTIGSLADPRPQWLPDPLLRAWDALTHTEQGTPLWPPLLACMGGALGAAWLARALWACGPAAMTLAGGIWLLAPGLLVSLAFGHDAQCVTTALIPVTLLAAHAVLTASGGPALLAASIGFAAALAAQMLGGHPQFVVYTAIALVPFAIERALAHGRLPRLVALAGAAALAAAMSAGVWLPALLFGAHAQRADPTFAARQAANFSLMPRDLLSLAWPRAVGYAGDAYWGGMRATDYSNALGLLAAGLAVLGALARRPGRRAAWAWAAVAVSAMLLSLGRNLPPLGAWVESLPVLGAFRTPITWLTLTVLSASLLAARGLEALLSVAPRGVWRAGLACLALGALALIARGWVVSGWLAAAEEAFEDRIAHGLVQRGSIDRFAAAAPRAAGAAANDLGLDLLLAGASLGALELARRRGGPRARDVAAGAIAVAAMAPLALLVLPALRAATGPRERLRIEPPPALARAAASDPLHRATWFDPSRTFSNDWIAWRARQVAGLSGAVPAPWDEASQAGLFGQHAFLRACAVRYVALPGPSGGDTLGTWPDSPPRAHAVGRVRALAGDAAVIAAMRHPGWDAAAVAFASAGSDREFPATEAVAIEWERDEPDALELRVHAPAEAFLVIADADFAGWRARLDGRRVGIERVDLLFRGVTIPAGEHRLTMDFEPEGWPMARALALGGWALALAAAVSLAGIRVRASARAGASAGPPPGPSPAASA